MPFPGDLTEFVVREVARTGWAVHTRIHVHAPAEEVMARINPAVGTVEAVSDTESVLVTGGDSVEVVAVWIGMLGLDFSVGIAAGAGRPPASALESLRAGGRPESRPTAREPSLGAVVDQPAGVNRTWVPPNRARRRSWVTRRQPPWWAVASALPASSLPAGSLSSRRVIRVSPSMSRLGSDAVEPRGQPPDPLADDDHEGGDDHHPDQERIGQHADREGEADGLDDDVVAEGETGEHTDHDDAAAITTRALCWNP